ncbi:Rha family transcriptional regulator [Paenibacillus sp. EKM102P]|uniref:Rha family transcriptional regulator n=1 Tax=unclassified Paenibacillus TaxID=185978 RepID=UPI00142E6B1F|nr:MULTISPECIES: Rha family transcriptional regulator [unclassified Paenibacillus]KAF6620522.1 Rha family transcriptional regulator [Paenibacillus sp. EKM101P]KAF6623514.1 Rha family transcriptional regulator [Paenibacillus sp. EKM102P]KAF6633922.1 Rha family transcriptional regulator [Paenibacillus sp. EKM10P]KAF6649450.1 Rha family transcriptional regulator [Paenibacillus sp. EKM11P]
MSKKLKTIMGDEFGITALDGIPVVSSRKVGEIFVKRHDHVLRDIANIQSSLPKIGESDWDINFIKSSYKNDRGKEYPEFLLTENGFTLLAMGFTGENAIKFKIKYIEKFNEMKKFIQERQLARIEYPALTTMIKMSHENPNPFHYSNEADMINKIVLGMTSKKFKEKHSLKKHQGIRDFMSHQQVEAIVKLQQVDVGLVASIKDISGRKKILEDYYYRIYGKLSLI